MKNKSSLTITIADDVRRRLEQAAQDDRRSLSGMVEIILLESGRLDRYYNGCPPVQHLEHGVCVQD